MIEATSEQHVKEIIATADPDHWVVLYFWAPWCSVCTNSQLPILTMFDEKNDNVTIVKVNVDDVPEPALDNGVRALPTFIFIRNNEQKIRVGLTGIKNLQQVID